MELLPLSSYYVPFDEMSNKKSTEQMRNAFLLKLDTQYTHWENKAFFHQDNFIYPKIHD